MSTATGACNICNSVADATCHHCDEWICEDHCQYFDTDGLPLSYCSDCLNIYLKDHAPQIDREACVSRIMDKGAELPNLTEILIKSIKKMDSVIDNQQLCELFETIIDYTPDHMLILFEKLVSDDANVKTGRARL